MATDQGPAIDFNVGGGCLPIHKILVSHCAPLRVDVAVLFGKRRDSLPMQYSPLAPGNPAGG